MTEAFYSFFSQYPLEKEYPFSFNHVFFRLFGLSPRNFFLYIVDKYHAILRINSTPYLSIFFATKKHSDEFVKELNLRMNQLVGT